MITIRQIKQRGNAALWADVSESEYMMVLDDPDVETRIVCIPITPSPEATQPTQAEAPSEREALIARCERDSHNLTFPFLAPTIKEQHEAAQTLRDCAAALATQQAALTQADMNAEYVRGRADGWNAARSSEGERRP